METESIIALICFVLLIIFIIVVNRASKKLSKTKDKKADVNYLIKHKKIK